MLGEVTYNFSQYKYRLEDENRLLLYHPRTGNIIMVHGKTRDFLLWIIDSKDNLSVDLEDKYVKYFIQNGILIKVD